MFDVLVHLPFKVDPFWDESVCLAAIALTLLGGRPFTLNIKNLPECWVVFNREPCGRKTQVLVTRKSGIICKYNRFSFHFTGDPPRDSCLAFCHNLGKPVFQSFHIWFFLTSFGWFLSFLLVFWFFFVAFCGLSLRSCPSVFWPRFRGPFPAGWTFFLSLFFFPLHIFLVN